MSEYQKYQTRTKVIILIFALAVAEQHMPGKTWRQLYNWITTWKNNLPSFLQENKDVSLKIQAYARENVRELSVKLMMEYLHNTIIPNLVKQSTGVGPEEEAYVSKKKELFERYGLKKLCISTVY